MPILIIFCILFMLLAALETYCLFCGPLADIPMSAQEWYEFYERVKFKNSLDRRKSHSSSKPVTLRNLFSSKKKSPVRAKYVVSKKGGQHDSIMAIVQQDSSSLDIPSQSEEESET